MKTLDICEPEPSSRKEKRILPNKGFPLQFKRLIKKYSTVVESKTYLIVDRSLVNVKALF